MFKIENARMPSVMRHNFSEVPRVETPRSQFDRSHGLKTTFNAGYLIPVICDEIYPGDTMNLRMQAFVRMTTPIVPLMDNLHLESFFFFVPCRLLWTNWKRFMGEQQNPDDNTEFLVPYLDLQGYGEIASGSNYDYMGLPLGVQDLPYINALPFRGINLIWNEWFRDQNLQNPVAFSNGDGPDSPNDYSTLLRRGKRHDYFTSSLPFPQKGPAVEIPLGESAIIRYDNFVDNAAQDKIVVVSSTGGGTGDGSFAYSDNPNDGGTPLPNGSGNNLYADLSTATAATINSLRQAFQLQRLYERDARGGTRYVELILSHWNTVSPDFRLQRPEYLGGGYAPVNTHPVPQTGATNETTPQGNLAAYSTAYADGHGFLYYATEHGYLIGFVSVRSDKTYFQGIDRMYSRRGKYDFAWPALAHIGEQAVLKKEIFAGAPSSTYDPEYGESVWGYQERYAELRYKNSRITGLMRPQVTGSIDIWHLADIYNEPVLDAAFIEENPPMARILAVPSEPHFIGDFYFKYHHARVLPTHGIPGNIDRF